MKRIILFILLLAGICANAQFIKPNNTYGTIYNRISPDSTFFGPTGCGAPSLNSVDLKKFAIFLDSCNHRFWIYDPKLSAWDSIHLGAAGGGSGGPFYDSTLMASTKRLKDTAAALRVARGNDQNILFNDAGAYGADDGFTFSKAFREMCLGCNITSGDAFYDGGGASHGAVWLRSQSGPVIVQGDSATVQATAGSTSIVRVVTNNTERLKVNNTGAITLPTLASDGGDTTNFKATSYSPTTHELRYNPHWPGGGAGASAFSALSDVKLTNPIGRSTPANFQQVRYDTSLNQWVNFTPLFTPSPKYYSDSVHNYGHSVANGASASTPDSSWKDRLQARTGVLYANFAQGGATIRNVIYQSFINEPAFSPTTCKAIQIALNDLGLTEAVTNRSKNNIPSLIEGDKVVFANHYIDTAAAASTMTATGTWTPLTATNSLSSKATLQLGGSPRKSTVSGSTLSVTMNGPGPYVIGTWGDTSAANLGSFSVKVDGVVVGTFSPSFKSNPYFYSSLAVFDWRQPAVFITPVLGSGVHTITVTTLSSTEVDIDYIARMMRPYNGKALIICHEIKSQPAGYTLEQGGTYERVDSANAALDTLVGFFHSLGYNSLRVAYPEHYINTWTDLSGDGLHPADAGHKGIFLSFMDAIGKGRSGTDIDGGPGVKVDSNRNISSTGYYNGKAPFTIDRNNPTIGNPLTTAAFILNNTSLTSAQTPFLFAHNGTSLAELRADGASNLSYIAFGGGGHYWYNGGDYGTGFLAMELNTSGRLNVGIADDGLTKLNVAGRGKFTYSNTSITDALLTFNNTSATGQILVPFTFNGVLAGGLRADYAGGFAWDAVADHSFFNGGDYGVGRMNAIFLLNGNKVFQHAAVNAVISDNSTAHLQVVDATQPQYAAHYDASHYTTFNTDASGNHIIKANGGTVVIDDSLKITGVNTGPSTDSVLTINNGRIHKSVQSGGSGVTDITVTRNATNVTIASSTGSPGTLAAADATHAGALDTARAKFIDSLRASGGLKLIVVGTVGEPTMYARGDSVFSKRITGEIGGNTLSTNPDSSLLDKSPVRELGDYYDDFTNSTTVETDGYSYTVAPTVQAMADGDKLFFTITGVTVGHATATRTIKAYFAGTQIFTSGAFTNASSAGWELRGWIIRNGTTARCSVSFNENGVTSATTTAYTNITSLDFTSNLLFKTTLQAGATGAATNDITEKMASFEWRVANTIHP